jgi:radical SAM protein with 4Fe4S-binding SPASM domain
MFMWISKRQMVAHALSTIKYITWQRIWNVLLLLTSFFVSRVLGRPRIYGTPWSLSVEPSGQCNLQCPECPVGAGVLTRKAGMLTPALFQKIVSDSGPCLAYLNLYFQGEPMLNRQIEEIIQIARHKRIYTSMSTNGHQLSPQKCEGLIKSGLTKLIVSVDGLTRESYSRYRKGGDLEKVKQGILTFIQQRNTLKSKTPFLVIQFLVFEHNEHEIPALKNWCKEFGVDKLELKSAQFYDFGNEEVRPPKNNKHSRYLPTQDKSLILKGKPYNHCYKQWSSAVVSWDGQMAPCCYDKDLDFSPGNIRNQSLKVIWKNETMQQFRQQILKDKAALGMCKNCPEGRQWLI